MPIDPLALCDGSCGSTKCSYFWYVQEPYWKNRFKDCSRYIWLGYRLVGNTDLTIRLQDLEINNKRANSQAITTACEDNVRAGLCLKVSNKEFFEVYKQLRGKS